ncbi:MAG: hypothetical protein NZ534_04370, partial [Bacteroidia bacterium]|nr:hypothetical protein [Bacteroidia bacterium]
MKRLLSPVAMLAVCTVLRAQISNAPEQDCINAIPICVGTYYQEQYYIGGGAIPNEINTSISCLGGNQEVNGTWYSFTVEQSGWLNITICAFQNGALYGSTYDYDWAVYNLTNHTCADIFNNASLDVGCNFSGFSQPGGCTGPNGQGGVHNGPPIFVQAGERYVLFVSRWTQTPQIGYVLNLCATTAVLSCPGDHNVVNIAPIQCGATSFTIEFEEPVRCSGVVGQSMTITGPSGPLNVTGIAPVNCNLSNPNATGTQFVVTVDQPISAGGEFSFQLPGYVNYCGDSVPGRTVSASIEIIGLNADAGPDLTHCAIGPGVILQPFVAPGFSYQWSPADGLSNPNIPNPVASPNSTTTYTLTVSNGDCSGTDVVTVFVLRPE